MAKWERWVAELAMISIICVDLSCGRAKCGQKFGSTLLAIPLKVSSLGKLRRKCWMISRTTCRISNLCWQAMSCEGWRLVFHHLMWTFLWVFRFVLFGFAGFQLSMDCFVVSTILLPTPHWSIKRLRVQLPTIPFFFCIPCPKLIKQKDKIPTVTARTWACMCL